MAITGPTGRTRPAIEYASILVLAAIAAIAIAAAVIATNGRSNQGEVTSSPAPASDYTYDSAPSTVIFYLVDTQEQADSIAQSEQEMLATYLQSSQQLPARSYSIFVGTTPEEVDNARNLAGLAAAELAEAGTNFNFVDLRGQ